ncbi:hypothetical protein PG996_009404 [Apiospora saccharicola]|uniref:Ethanolamine utilization protein n=1 Tax=Apiospora saccharicola TaxID=335842 RepID=A0ABR1UKM9_9PEZI
MAPVAFSYQANAQSTFKPPVLSAENDNAFLGDVFSSDQINPDKPMSAGFYRLEKGKPLVYTYTYDEMKIIVEGDFTISDTTGQEVKAKPGDVFFFPDGATITFTTDNGGLAFFCGQRKKI